MALAGGFSRAGNADTGGGVLLAVGLVVAFFGWWSWWAVVGIALTAAGVLWLATANRHE
ncbi:hypothetical protein Amsp01_063950 [Amycolatopsis sp. NBRC 101858]|uniref:hypothetical protein n=1 Tax=Amycolatopsis sp. NBRC 101858 TaxID=3032200 RepID=UPI0024A262DC|nr:hypothetical protein [Amycolatopsis sp. NBRC 101858]GLY40372.1 hypothetical protein Amsp01_063950 [Amycolatopsis sp. NBRC 101858]